MKNKTLVLLGGLQIIMLAVAQDQINSTRNNEQTLLKRFAVAEAPEVIAAVKQKPTFKETIAQKIKKFTVAFDYLNRSRDCLSGIGCTKKQSYLANYLLGAAIGMARVLPVWQIGFERYAELQGKIGTLSFIAEELGYRYLLQKKSVYLFRCLTFRGCDDQTKRYLLYRLGLLSGLISAGILYGITHKEEIKQIQEREILEETARRKGYKNVADYLKAYAEEMAKLVPQASIEVSEAVQKELGLESLNVQWYEVLGFKRKPSSKEAREKYRKLAILYHPDRAKQEGDKPLYEEISQALNAAKENIPAEEGKQREEKPKESSSMTGVD